MKRAKKNWEPLEGLSKSELEELRTKTEILKLRREVEEKNKNWVSKNIGILIPSFIALLTLLTGYFTGFFNVEAKRLEIKRDLLAKDIQEFTAKKDSLSKTNIELNEKNNLLINAKNRLEQEKGLLINDTLELKQRLLSINGRLREIEIEKKQLGADVIYLNREKASLEKEKTTLQNKAQKLNEDLNKSGFASLLDRFIIAPDHLFLGRPIRDSINYGTGVFKDEYIKMLQGAIDTAKDLALKGVGQYLMYTLTKDKKWRDWFLNTGDDICESINSSIYQPNLEYSYYWNVFGSLAWGDHLPTNKTEFVQRMIGYIKKIRANSYEVANILIALKSLSWDIDSRRSILDELRKPEVFCFLISKCQKVAFDGNTDVTLLLERIAPIAYCCLISELLSDSQFRIANHDFTISELIGKAQFLIEKNNNAFESVPFSSTQGAWSEWQQKNQKILTVFKNVSNNCNSEVVVQLVGRDRYE